MKEIYSFKKTKGEGENSVIYEFIMKKLSRSDKDDIDTQYATYLSKMIQAGILTKAAMIQYDESTGGKLSKDNAKYIQELYTDIAERTKQLTRIELENTGEKSDKVKEEIRSLNEEIGIIQRSIIDFESFHSSIFDNSAEVKARNKTIEFCVLNYSYIKTFTEKEKDPISTPLFKGETTREKMDSLDEYEESENKALIAGINSLYALWAFYYMTGKVESLEFEKIIGEAESMINESSE